MDQFSAHLDRGWDLVQRGDPRGAELSARRALEIDSQSPEAYNPLGYVAARKGEFDAATEHCRRFPEGPFENPNHTFLVGRALYEIGDLDRAFPLIDDAVKRSPK